MMLYMIITCICIDFTLILHWFCIDLICNNSGVIVIENMNLCLYFPLYTRDCHNLQNLLQISIIPTSQTSYMIIRFYFYQNLECGIHFLISLIKNNGHIKNNEIMKRIIYWPSRRPKYCRVMSHLDYITVWFDFYYSK